MGVGLIEETTGMMSVEDEETDTREKVYIEQLSLRLNGAGLGHII